MTAPVSHGYPDWGRFQAQADTLLDDQDNVVINASQSHNIGFVGNYPAIGTFFRADTNHFEIEFDYYEDAAFTNFMDNYLFTVRSGQTFNRNVPVLGPYLQIVVNPSAAASQYDIRIWSAPNFAIPSNGTAAGTIIISSTNLSVAATTTTTLTGARVAPGAAIWNVHSDAADWTATLRSIDQAGTVVDMDFVTGGLDNEFNRFEFLPGTTIQILLRNNDASASNFWTYLQTRPMYAGA